MGNIIGVVSQKGGPGKSTIARAIATSFAAHDWNVKIADMDTKQSSTVGWLKRRLDNGIKPDVAVESFGSVSRALKVADQYDLLVFDAAPHASEATVEIAQAADLVVIPTSLALDDLEPAVILAATLVQKHGIPLEKIAIALSKCGDSQAELRDVRAYLGETPYLILDGQIPEKTSLRQAQDIGQSITESQHAGPRAKADQVIQAIIDRFEKLTA
ncbi:ParA family protein [Salinicola sp. CPA57]|uniref:ParA family protein n=1 Tax=unclassified Salinicola TaxID=2634022 RepID=UPI000DA1F9BC|nr:ParA family protein [Salinicola sp. CPA57]